MKTEELLGYKVPPEPVEEWSMPKSQVLLLEAPKPILMGEGIMAQMPTTYQYKTLTIKDIRDYMKSWVGVDPIGNYSEKEGKKEKDDNNQKDSV